MDTAMLEKMNIKLVKEVEKYPCLYQKDNGDYHCKHITDAAWAEVGKVVGWTGPKCKEKFKNIRSVVIRYKKMIQSGVRRRPYYLEEHMRFTFPYILPLTNDKSTLDNEDTSPDVARRRSEDYTNMLLYEVVHKDEDMQESEVKIEPCSSNPASPQYYAGSHSPTLEAFDGTPLPSPTPERAETQSRKLLSSRDKPQTSAVRQSDITDPLEITSDSKDFPSQLQNDSKKMFLLSLLPDFYAMDDLQTRKFKREVLNLVDNILCDSKLKIPAYPN